MSKQDIDALAAQIKRLGRLQAMHEDATMFQVQSLRAQMARLYSRVKIFCGGLAIFVGLLFLAIAILFG